MNMLLFVIFFTIVMLTGNSKLLEIISNMEKASLLTNISSESNSTPQYETTTMEQEYEEISTTSGPLETVLDELESVRLVVYRMTFEGLWSEERFPKSYPKFRPPAQWSMVFGQTHNASHSIFHIGDLSSFELQTFAEKGDARSLAKTLNSEDVFDQFSTSPILVGTGNASQDIFLQADHSLVSIVCRIIPSPDWFVGVDSINLLVNGSWIDNVTLSLHPLDAGTDGGLTFTSPKWKLQKPLPIQIHTSKEPKHGAASFFYPNMEALPDIARVTFIKIGDVDLANPEITSVSPDESVTERTMDINDNEVETASVTSEDLKSDMPSTTYSESVSKMLHNMTSRYANNESYFPKLLRPEIQYSYKKNIRKKIENPQSNLQTSFISSRRNHTNVAPSHFNW